MKTIKNNDHAKKPQPARGADLLESSSKQREHTHKIGTPRTSWGPICDRGIPEIGDPKAYAAWKKAREDEQPEGQVAA